MKKNKLTNRIRSWTRPTGTCCRKSGGRNHKRNWRTRWKPRSIRASRLCLTTSFGNAHGTTPWK